MTFNCKQPINVDISNQAAVKCFAQQLIEHQYDDAGTVSKVIVKCNGRELFVQMKGGNPNLKYVRHCFESYGWDCETIDDCKSLADIMQHFGY